jgi:hypothetical protein
MDIHDVAALEKWDRKRLAVQAGLSVEFQRLLAADPDADVQRLLASNTGLALEVQKELANHRFDIVRCVLARNASLAPELQRRAVRAGGNVGAYAVMNPNLLAELQREIVESGDESLHKHLCRNPSLLVELQVELASDVNLQICLAQNPGLALEVQEVLAHSHDEHVRTQLASSSALAPEVQVALACDASTNVQRQVAFNEAVVLTDAFALEWLELSARGRDFTLNRFDESGLDPEELSILRDGWSGTLGELLETARELSAQGA